MKNAQFYADNHLKPPKAFWEWCYDLFPIYKWSNKSQTIVSSNRKGNKVIEKRLSKNSRLTFYESSRICSIILCTSKRIEIQVYAISSSYTKGKQQFSTRLVNIEIFENDKHIKVTHEVGEKYKFGYASDCSVYGKYIPYHYDNHIEKRLEKISELKYLKLPTIQPRDLLQIYKYRERIEFSQKINANKLQNELIHGGYPIDMRVVTMNFLKTYKQFFLNSNRGYKDYLLKQKIEQRGVKMVLGVEKYIDLDDISEIPETTRFLKLQNYLIKQQCRYSYYRDYLNLLDDIGIPENKQIKFPSDLVLSHDRAVTTFNSIKKERELLRFSERKQELQHMEMTIGEYIFVLPETSDDIVQEGIELSHCVGGSQYINGHARGTTTILFIRKKSNPDKSFFTMEYKREQVEQLEGYKNEVDVPSNLQLAVDEWLRRVNSKKILKQAS